MHPRASVGAAGASVLLLIVLVVAMLPSQAATVNYGSYGTHPTTTSRDFVTQLEDLPATQIPFLAREEAGNAGVTSDDFYYIHFQAAPATTSKSVGDIRLVVPSGGTGAAGDVLTSGVGSYTEIIDLDASATAGDAGDNIAGFLAYLEMDGKPGFSAADWLYVDVDDDGALSEGDLRVSTPSTSGTSASTVSVTATDRHVGLLDDDYLEAISATEDALPDTATFETVAFTIRYFDADTDGRFDTGDTLVMVPADAPSQDLLGLGHVFLSKSGSRAHGNHVGTGTAGTRPLLDTLAATDAYLVTTSTVGDAWHYDLYIHFGSPDGEPSGTPDCDLGPVATAAAGDLGYVQHGDVILRKGATGTTGAAASYMTRVTSESTGAGTEITACAPLAANIYYVNNPDSSSGFTDDDFLYLNIPATGFAGTDDAADGLDINDLRLTRVTFSATFNAGTTIRTGNADLTSLAASAVNADSAAAAWHILHYDIDQSRGVALQTLANAKFMDADSNDLWDPATEEIYISSDAAVSNGDIRIHAADSTETGSTTALHTVVDCDGLALPDDTDCTNVIEANTDIKVTGPDTTWDVDQGEFVIWSPDAWATTGHDRAVTPIGGVVAGGTLTGAVALTAAWSNSGDSYYFQWDEVATPDGGLAILKVHDVKWASTPTYVTVTASEFVPTLHRLAVGDNALAVLDTGSGNPTTDGFYLRVASTGASLATNDLRLTPTEFSTGGHAGKLLTSANSVERTSTALTDSATEFDVAVRFVDLGSTGFDIGDPVYLDMPVDIGGNTFGTFSSFDIRLTTVTYSGENHKPGTFVRIGHEDLSDLSFAAWSGTTGYRLYFFDENRDADFNGDDMLYLVHVDNTGATPATALPDLLSLRMIGDGGATSSATTPGSGGGGGQTTTPRTTTTTTTTSATTTTTAPIDEPTVAVTLANAGLATSLEVRRIDGDNILSWDVQPGVAGYQVWVSTPPYTHVADINDPQVRTYTHEDGPASGSYLVTAWAVDGQDTVGKLVDVNEAVVKGNEDRTGVPIPADGGTSTGTGGPDDDPKKPVPGLGVLVLMGVLASLVVVVRRRL